MPTQKLANEKEISLTNRHSTDGIYCSAKGTFTRIPLHSNESDTFITADGSSKIDMPKKKKDSSRYFTADETNNNQDIVEMLPEKKKTNFHAYIEEIVKQKSHNIQSLDDNLIQETPIDIFNDEIFSKIDENSNDINLNHINPVVENRTEPLTQFERSAPNTTQISNKIKGYHVKRVVSNTGLRICDNSMLREENSCCKNILMNISNMNLDSQIGQFTLKPSKSSRKLIPSSNLLSNSIEDEDVIFVDNSPPKVQKFNKECIFNSNTKSSSSKKLTTCNFSEPIIIEDITEELCKGRSFTQTSNGQNIESQVLSKTDLSSGGWLNKYNQTTFTCVLCKSKFVGRKTYKSHLNVHKRNGS